MSADRLTDLLLAWEQSVMSGKPLSAAELCSNCPELISDLNSEIQRLKSLEQFMFPRSFQSTVAASVNDPPAVDDFSNSRSIKIYPTLPGYEFLCEIGRGGMGVVYKARQISLNRTVAVKMLAGSRWAQPGYVARLRQEANSLAQLDDPRIVKVFDIIETQTSVSLVLEFVEGENLSFLLRGKPIQSSDAAKIALEVARTLTVVHRRQMLHRDIKPPNVMINSQGGIKITDFGLAKDLTSTGGPTEQGDLVGTPSYMAPEQTRGPDTQVDQRTDVYAVGATLYEMLTGRPPFIGKSTMETLSLVQKGNPRLPITINPRVPHDLQTICMKCLELDPDHRFDTAKELGDELERFLLGHPILSRPISPAERFVRSCRQNPTVASLGALTTVAMIATLTIAAMNYASQRRNLIRFNDELTRLNEGLRETAAHATEMQRIAEENERIAQNSLYAADINRAVLAWRQEDTREMNQVLNRHIPQPGQIDRRGFVWWFLHHRSQIANTVVLKTGQPQYLLRYTRDGRSMVTAGLGAVVRFFDPETAGLQREISTEQVEINGVTFSPDSKEMATSGDDGTIRLWDLQTGQSRLTIKTPFRKVYEIQYLPDGRQIIACATDRAARIFDTRTGDMVGQFEGHTDSIESFILSDDGKTLLTVANDRMCRVWEVETRRELSSMETTGNVETFILAQKGRLMITGSGQGYLRTIDIHEKREIGVIPNLDRMSSLALHPDGSTLAVGDASGKIRLRRIGESGTFLEDHFHPWQAHEGVVGALVWSKQGDRLISTGNDGRVISWDYVAAQQVSPYRMRLVRSPDEPPIPNQSELILMNSFGTASSAWDPKTGCPPFRTIDKGLANPMISPDGKYAAAIKDERTLELFAVSDDPTRPLDERCIASWKADGALRAWSFAADSRKLVATMLVDATEKAPVTSRVIILNVPDLTVEPRIHEASEKSVAVSADGTLLSTVTSDSVVMYDLSTKTILWKEPQLSGRFQTFSPNGKLIATSVANRSIVIRDARTGERLFTLVNHRAAIRNMAFASDNHTLVTSTESGSVVFTHAATGQELVLVEFPNIGDVQRLLFLGHGRYLVCQVRRPDAEMSDEVVIFDSGHSTEDIQSSDSKLR